MKRKANLMKTVLAIEVQGGVVTPVNIPCGITLKVIDWDIEGDEKTPHVTEYH